MKRVEILWFILMMVYMFWLWSTGWHGVAFISMSVYAAAYFIMYAMEVNLTKLALSIIEEWEHENENL